jgi:hypothetical protein
MDRIILGDNQFFGVNHMSEEKGMQTMRRFQENRAIIEVLDRAYELGVHAFTFSTHDRVAQICDHFRANPEKYADLRLYPAIPYAEKYAHAVTEKGILGAIMDVVFTDNTAGGAASMIARGGAMLLNKDAEQLMKLLVDAELKMFYGLRVEVVFLQNIVTDLLLGLGWKEMLASFARHVQDRYGVQAGFITRNMPRLVDLLLEAGLESPIVCSAINKVGFQMNPDIASCEEALRNRPFRALAMSVLAAGAVAPAEAIEYVGQFGRIESVVFGASSRSHIEQTKSLIYKQWNSKS